MPIVENPILNVSPLRGRGLVIIGLEHGLESGLILRGPLWDRLRRDVLLREIKFVGPGSGEVFGDGKSPALEVNSMIKRTLNG
jgi:hypothetical protein